MGSLSVASQDVLFEVEKLFFRGYRLLLIKDLAIVYGYTEHDQARDAFRLNRTKESFTSHFTRRDQLNMHF